MRPVARSGGCSVRDGASVGCVPQACAPPRRIYALQGVIPKHSCARLWLTPHPVSCSTLISHILVQGQALRVVDIGGGVDVAPCGGVYVGNTAELQLLQVRERVACVV